MNMVNLEHVAPGFRDTVSASQAVFRAALAALSRPGTVLDVASDATPPAGVSAAATALLLALLDQDVSLYMTPTDCAAAAYFRFHTGCTLTSTLADADFVFVGVGEPIPPLSTLKIGSEYCPEQSATLVREVAGIDNTQGFTLRGPGIQTQALLAVTPPEAVLVETRAEMARLLPRGVDIFFTCANQLCGLPRSTRIEA